MKAKNVAQTGLIVGPFWWYLLPKIVIISIGWSRLTEIFLS